MTEREAPPERGFDYRQDDPYEEDGWFGREQVSEPTYYTPEPTYQVAEPTYEVDEPAHTEPTHRVTEPRYEVPERRYRGPINPVRQDRYEPARDVDTAPMPPPPRRVATPTVNTWTVNGQLRPSSNSTMSFRAAPVPWHRTKQARIALVAAASVAVIVPIGLLAWPESSSTAPSPSTSVAPQPSPSIQPTLSTAPPTPINLPPPPPPPPPPPEDTGSAPSVNQPYWTRPAAPPEKMPEIDVTRAPISVAPVPRKPPQQDLGSSDKPGCAGWC